MLNAACVTDLQNRVPDTACPSCGQRHLQFVLRCDLGTKDCLTVVRCDSCQSVFNVDADTFPADCARCHQTLELVTLTCATATHSCRYVLRCPRCGAH